MCNGLYQGIFPQQWDSKPMYLDHKLIAGQPQIIISVIALGSRLMLSTLSQFKTGIMPRLAIIFTTKQSSLICFNTKQLQVVC